MAIKTSILSFPFVFCTIIMEQVPANKHFNTAIAHSIVNHQLGRDQESLYFQHWKNCGFCRKLLSEQKHTAGFTMTSQKPLATFLLSSRSTIPYHMLYSEDAVLAISFSCDDINQKIRTTGVNPQSENPPGFSLRLISEIDTYLKHGTEFNIPPINVFFIKSNFMLQALFWTWLIPFGTVVSYGDIANWCDKPKAARAIGGALHNNPVPFLVPCHRVIGKNGRLTGFSAGIEIKHHLLAIEKGI